MAGSNNLTETIYVELDALLDTRLGTVARISNSAASELLAGNYHLRDDDNFKNIDMDEYRELYANRDVITLSKSMVTDALNLIKQLVKVLLEQSIGRPYHDGCRIVVNVFPYKLSGEEQEELTKVIGVWVNDKAPVNLINVSIEELTPVRCKNSYSTMIMYEYTQWLEFHAEAFKVTRLPEVLLFAPAIYYNKTPTLEELEAIVKEAAHPMHALELLVSPLIELNLINVRHFSIIKSD